LKTRARGLPPLSFYVSVLTCMALLSAILATSSWAVASPALTVSVLTDKGAYRPGEPVTISGLVLKDGSPISGASVGIIVKNPLGGTVFVDQRNTGADGRYSTSFTLPSDAMVGQYNVGVTATYGGESATSSTSFRVKLATTLTCSVSPSTVVIGGSVTVSGAISPSVSGATVTLTFTRPDGSTTTISASTRTDGSYTTTYVPNMVGSWSVVASWAGDDTYFGATSPTTSFTVTKIPSSITLSVNATSIYLGRSVLVEGILSPAVSGAVVTINYTRPDGTVISRPLATNATGGFRDVFKPDVDGVWKIRAGWAGDATHSPALSSVYELTVVKKKPSTITCSVAPSTVQAYGTMTIYGAISPARAFVQVVLQYRLGESWIDIAIVKTVADGSYKYTWAPANVGSYLIRAYWLGDAEYEGSMSAEQPLTVVKGSSSLTISAIPSYVVVGGNVTLSGFLSPRIPNIPITIMMRTGGGPWANVSTVSTGVDGVYRYVWTVPSSGVFQFKSLWPGNANLDGCESNVVNVTVVAKSTTINCTAKPGKLNVGEKVTFNGFISPPVSGVDVIIEVVKPDGSTVRFTNKTSARGEYVFVYCPDIAGTYTVQASWLGNSEYAGSTSIKSTFEVVKAPSTIVLTPTPSSAELGSTVSVLGRIHPPRANVEVNVTYIKPSGVKVSKVLVTSANGTFSDSITLDEVGVWGVVASWPGDASYTGSSSSSSFMATKKVAAITLVMSPSLPKVGEDITFSGMISPAIANATINIRISTDGGSTWGALASVPTDFAGRYSYVWRVPASGLYAFKSDWPGSAEYEGAESQVIKVVISKEVKQSSVVLPTGATAIVSSSSNSTTIDMKFDAEKSRVVMNVTGPSKTTGLSSIFIPLTLLRAYNTTIERLTFLVDGVPVTPTITTLPDGYIVTVSYTHSVHVIEVYVVTYTLTVKVLDYKGAPLPDAKVAVRGPINTYGLTNGTGFVTFSRLPSGDYSLEVYYGPKVGSSAIKMIRDSSLTINTVVGKLEADYEQLAKSYNELRTAHEQLAKNYSELQKSFQDLLTKHEQLTSSYNSLMTAFVATTVVLILVIALLSALLFKRRKQALKAVHSRDKP